MTESKRRKKSCREQFTLSADFVIPSTLSPQYALTASLIEPAAVQMTDNFAVSLHKMMRGYCQTNGGLLKLVSRFRKLLLDRSNQKMQSQLHFEALSPPMADIDSHAQLIPHLRIREWPTIRNDI